MELGSSLVAAPRLQAQPLSEASSSSRLALDFPAGTSFAIAGGYLLACGSSYLPPYLALSVPTSGSSQIRAERWWLQRRCAVNLSGCANSEFRSASPVSRLGRNDSWWLAKHNVKHNKNDRLQAFFGKKKNKKNKSTVLFSCGAGGGLRPKRKVGFIFIVSLAARLGPRGAKASALPTDVHEEPQRCITCHPARMGERGSYLHKLSESSKYYFVISHQD